MALKKIIAKSGSSVNEREEKRIMNKIFTTIYGIKTFDR